MFKKIIKLTYKDLYHIDEIYNSLDVCESVCPDSLQITTVSSPDGTGEYFTMYCKNNN